MRKAEYRQMAGRLRALALVARHREIQAELTWLADSYDRLAAQMDGSEALFAGEDNLTSGEFGTAVAD